MNIECIDNLPHNHSNATSIMNFRWFNKRKIRFRGVSIKKSPNEAWLKMWALYEERIEYNQNPDFWIKDITFDYGLEYYLKSNMLNCFFKRTFNEDTDIDQLEYFINLKIVFLHDNVINRSRFKNNNFKQNAFKIK